MFLSKEIVLQAYKRLFPMSDSHDDPYILGKP